MVGHMSDEPPTLSVGLAVYNGERYLEQAIESILSQTFADFELIISDNASTDRTGDIARHYAAIDDRVRYHRNDTNIGGANNENLTFQLARGRYFRLAAHDDRCAPGLFEACVGVLESRPDVVLCYSDIVEIDEDDREIGRTAERLGLAATPEQRLSELADRNHHCEATYGILRSSVARGTRMQENYTNSDRVWLCELAMHGPFAAVPETLFYKRYHPRNVYVDWHARMAWFRPGASLRVAFPNWLELRALVRLVLVAPLPLPSRLRCLRVVAGWTYEHWKELAKDVVYSAQSLLRLRSIDPPETRNWEP